MKYTRYEYKKQGKMKPIFIILTIALLSIVIGMYFGKFIFKGNLDISSFNQQQIVVSDQEFIALQFGYYSNKDNAETAMKTIPSKYNSYIVEEDDHYRVVIGLYSKEDGEKELETLISQGINAVKINFSISKENLEQNKIAEIINAFLKINNTLEDENVKSVKTSDYKIWCSNIVNNDNLDENNSLKEVNDYINNLPDEVNKNNVNEYLKYFYERLKNM
ncbi:SPOR domain-containing protein [Clostridium botulinum]|uniref:SPOR domain-containing protein n=1 Tax=Clostridium botulinum TaxID=1491 RepID=UPI000774294E|nr:SPOR domain-containing protein [Clostridium botulinum]NFE95746.1 SPOR domain-containing protein [Clostridium botulinum]NFH68819.1 SPOR domain-containing protein [Clostridium botulinum]NFL37657.1 SPOR domain-containing protein [Clostridium botulinum]NFL66206.1 SPOR domain-containing protein [Clostridium botulinum]NFN07495.1 SPOR domain-containing protein [Clostridium botulinum]